MLGFYSRNSCIVLSKFTVLFALLSFVMGILTVTGDEIEQVTRKKRRQAGQVLKALWHPPLRFGQTVHFGVPTSLVSRIRAACARARC